MTSAKCRSCNVTIPGDYLHRAYRVQDGPHTLAFCNKDCATKWALAEVPRRGDWLRKITTETHGKARDIAVEGLYSNLPPRTA